MGNKHGHTTTGYSCPTHTGAHAMTLSASKDSLFVPVRDANNVAVAFGRVVWRTLCVWCCQSAATRGFA